MTVLGQGGVLTSDSSASTSQRRSRGSQAVTMATTSSLPSKGVGLVLVEYEYKYQGRDGVLVSIKPNERYILLSKTNDHWWQVQSNQSSKPFYIPAKYVKELPPDFPLLLGFTDPPSQEPVLLPSSVPAPVPVPVPIPKTLDEPVGNKLKAGDEVTIRLRPDQKLRKTENRMSTFGVPLDFQEPSPLMLPQHFSGNPSTGVTEIRTPSRTDDNIKIPEGVPEDHRDPGKPPDPITATRTQPIPVETPVVPPYNDLLKMSPPSRECDENQESPIEVEEEEEQSCKEEEEDSPKDEDSNHIYESIQDLNLDVEALTRGQASPGGDVGPAEVTPLTQDHSSVDLSTPIYANVSGLKKSSSQICSPSSPPPELCSAGRTISPTSSLDTRDGQQVSSDQGDQKPSLLRSRTEPAGLADPDQSAGPLLSPTSSQGSAGWEQRTDKVSGRFYFYNPATGATSWTIPEPVSPTSPASPSAPTAAERSDNVPPPLPEEDYPLEENNDISTTTVTMNPQQHLIPRAHLDLPDGNEKKWRLQEFPSLSQRLMGNGVSEEGPMVQVKNWRHSVAEDVHRRNLSDSTDRKYRRHSPDSQQSHLLEKAGIINKTKVAEGGKKIRKNWTQSWTVLHGGVLTFHRDPKSAPVGNTSKTSQIVPEFTEDLRGASVGWASKDKSSKKNVLELKTRQGCEYLMQYDTESIISDWLKVLQDAIRQLDQDYLHLSEEEDEAEDDRDKRRTADRNSSGASDSEQKRVRTKLRRFLQRRPTLQSVKEKGYIRDNVFGCHLDTLCHREHTTIPRFVAKCVKTVEKRGLDIDGIYRVSGNLAVIQKLRHRADHEDQLDLEDGQWEEIHVITGALKLFLRELPEPLFPFSSFDKFIAAIQLPDYNLRVSYMRDLVRSLPLPNHDTMELLFRHLRRVTEHRDCNRMSVQSLAIVFGPTLLRPQTESANMTVHMVFQSQIVELILNEFQVVFSSN